MKRIFYLGYFALCLLCLWYFLGCAATKETVTTYDKDGKVISVNEKLNNYYVSRTTPKTGNPKETYIPKPGWWTTIFTSFFKEIAPALEDVTGTVTSK